MTVYSDIGAPTPMPFIDANVQMLDGADTQNTVATGGIVALEPDILKHAQAISLDPASTGASTTYSVPTGMAALTFEGTFGGAMGDFSCEGSTCKVTLDDKGTVTGIEGTWNFDADVDAMVHIPDTEYLHFGWWVKAPDAADGKYTFQTFAGASTEATNVTEAMTGTATYAGAAAGVYVLKDVSGGLVTGASNGDFTASATLTADFEVDAINGSITDFVNGAGDSMDGWSVTLNNAGLDNTASFSGTTLGKIGDGSGAGNWTGTFYGEESTARPDDSPVRPTDVAGRFDAHLPGAHIAGAYGASKQ